MSAETATTEQLAEMLIEAIRKMSEEEKAAVRKLLDREFGGSANLTQVVK